MDNFIEYEYMVYPRFKDTDEYGIIHHSQYLSYIEEAKIALLHDKKFFDSDVIDEEGGTFPVRDLYIKYLKSVKYENGQPLTIKIKLTVVHEFKLNFEFNLFYKGKKVAKGKMNNIYLNSKGVLQSTLPEKLTGNYCRLLNVNKCSMEKEGR